MKKSKGKKMNFEGEKGTENVEVAKLETSGIRNKEVGHNPDPETSPVVGFFDPLKNLDYDPTHENIYRDEKLMALLHWFGEPELEESKPIQINSKAIEAKTTTATERNIPPHDVEATSPDMAYPLNKIIFKGDWKYLLDIFELVEAGSDVSPHVYPTFVCNRVHKIGAIKNKKQRKRMAGILSYITHLIKYKDRHSLDGVSSMRRHKLPSFLAQRFSSLFDETEDKRIRDEKQQLLISYVLVLSLFADDFRSDPSDIAKDLRMSPILLRAHYEYLGCKISKEKVVVATLAVPLEFRTTKRKRRR